MDFTLEIGGSQIHFLDLTLQLVPAQQMLKVEFAIYRKPTYTGVSIAHDSKHATDT